MAKLRRTVNGLIYYNDFISPNIDPTIRTTLNDSTRYIVGNDYLRILHGDIPMKMFIQIDSPQYIVEIKNEYLPEIAGDEGGISVFQGEEDYIDFLEYYDRVEGITNAYEYLMVEKNNIDYYAYWSNNGINWNFKGSSSMIFANENVGVVLYGSTGKDLIIDYIKVYKSLYIKLINIFVGTTVEVYDINDNPIMSVVADTTEVSLRLPYYPFTGYFKFKLGTVEEQTEVLTMWGGSEYIKQDTLDIKYSDNYIENFEEIMLGNLDMDIVTSFKVVNNTTRVYNNVIIQVKQYDNNSGYLLADVSLENVEDSYFDTVIIPTLDVGQEVEVWVRLVRDPNILIERSKGIFDVMISHS